MRSSDFFLKFSNYIVCIKGKFYVYVKFKICLPSMQANDPLGGKWLPLLTNVIGNRKCTYG